MKNIRNLSGLFNNNNLDHLPPALRLFLNSIRITDIESAREDVFRFLPQEDAFTLIYILESIHENRALDMVPINIPLSRIFTTVIPDLLWKRIEIDGHPELVRLTFNNYDWLILGRLCCLSDCTMHIFNNNLPETDDKNVLTLLSEEDYLDDLLDYFKAVKNGEIASMLSYWSGIAESELSIYLSAFLTNPFDFNPLGLALKKRFPTVYETYRANWQVWRGNIKFWDIPESHLYIIPDFLLMVKNMIIENVYMQIQYELPNIPVGISKNGFIVPKEHYVTLVRKCIGPAFEQLLYTYHPTIRADYL